jgi:hypothetical protein
MSGRRAGVSHRAFTVRPRALCLALLGVGVLVFATPASAQPSPEEPAVTDAETTDSAAREAEQHFQRARQLYDEGDFTLSLVEFQRAYELSPNFRVLYNIGQVNIQTYDYAAARLALEAYLRDGGDDVPASLRERAETDLRMLRGRTAHLRVLTTPKAEVALDDAPLTGRSSEEPLLVNAGRRKVTATRAGYAPVTRWVTLAGGDRADVTLELMPLTAEPPQPLVVPVPVTTTTESRKNYTPAVVGWIATGALAVSAGIVGGLYLSKEAEVERLSDPSREVGRAAADDATASADRLAVAADVLTIVAVGAGIASLYLTLRPPRTEVTKPATSATLRLLPNGFRGTF